MLHELWSQPLRSVMMSREPAIAYDVLTRIADGLRTPRGSQDHHGCHPRRQ
jgi:hypothetical protein